MPIADGLFSGGEAVLEWRFAMRGGVIDLYDHPGFDGPDTWLDAVAAVARDLHCLRHGREINVDRIIWGLAVNDDWLVMVGWQGPRLDGFACGGLMLDTPFAEVVAWIADAVQTELAGNEFVQWPSRGQRLLKPQLGEDGPVWIDTAAGEPVAAIGNLCKGIA